MCDPARKRRRRSESATGARGLCPPQKQRPVVSARVHSTWVVAEVVWFFGVSVGQIHRPLVLSDNLVRTLGGRFLVFRGVEAERFHDRPVEAPIGVLVPGEALFHRTRRVRELCLGGIMDQRYALGPWTAAVCSHLESNVDRVPCDAVELLPLAAEAADVRETVSNVFQLDIPAVWVERRNLLGPRVELVVPSGPFGEKP